MQSSECGFVRMVEADMTARGIMPTFCHAVKTYFNPRQDTFKVTVWARALHALHRSRFAYRLLGGVVYLLRHHYEVKYGVQVKSSIAIGPGLHIVHGGNVYLNCASIGKNFTVYQGVTLGAKGGRAKALPTIGDNVTIYTNAVVVGGIRIGDGAVIGANSFVSTDVPPHTLVAGVPAHVVKQLHGDTTC